MCASHNHSRAFLRRASFSSCCVRKRTSSESAFTGYEAAQHGIYEVKLYFIRAFTSFLIIRINLWVALCTTSQRRRQSPQWGTSHPAASIHWWCYRSLNTACAYTAIPLIWPKSAPKLVPTCRVLQHSSQHPSPTLPTPLLEHESMNRYWNQGRFAGGLQDSGPVLSSLFWFVYFYKKHMMNLPFVFLIPRKEQANVHTHYGQSPQKAKLIFSAQRFQRQTDKLQQILSVPFTMPYFAEAIYSFLCP